MRELTIEPPKTGKGRSFKAILLAYAEANSLWEGGQTSTDTIRPIWMMLAGTDNELRPFVINLQTGRRAEMRKNSYDRRPEMRIEILKSVGYQTTWQRTPLGSVVTIFLPDLFRLDPGMVDPKGAAFCLLPAKAWLKPNPIDHLVRIGGDPEKTDLEAIASLAPLFIAYLDRRTRCPIIPDQRFYAQVLYAALDQGLASFGTDHRYYYDSPWGVHRRLAYKEDGTHEVGLAKGLAFQVDHESLEAFLAEQVKIYEALCG